jgi:chromosome segregation ATPase
MIETEAARRVLGDLNIVVKSLEELSVTNDELRTRCARMEQDYFELQKSQESTRRERDDASEALAEAQAAYTALLNAHEAGTQELQRLEKTCQTLLHEREQATEALEALLRRLRD